MSESIPPGRGARGRLWIRLLAGYAALVACVLVLLAIPLHYGLQTDYVSRATESFERALSQEMPGIVQAAERGDRGALDLACGRLNQGFNGRVSLIDAEGNVLADNLSAHCMERARPECLPHILSLRRRQARDTTSLEDTVTLRIPVRLGSAGPATARLALPIEPVRRQMARMSRLLVLTGAGALALAGLLSVWLARRIARPIEDMTRVAERIAAGDFGCPAPEGGPGEVGRLAQAVATMQLSLRRTLSDLREERNQARAIVAGMSDGVIAVTRDLEITCANAAAARLLGMPGLAPGTRFAPPPALAPVLEQAIASASPASVEIGDVRRGDRAVHVAISPLGPGEGGGAGAVLVLGDRTEARRAEVMGRELVANASHELRTPLAIMTSTADTLLAWSGGLSPQHRELVEILSRQAERMQRLVNETLQLSQLESGLPPGPPERLALDDIARQVVRDLEPLARERGVGLAPPESSGPCAVLGWEQPLTSAVANLVDNALRYTPAGGRVTVRVTGSPAEVVAEVADTGPGIPPAAQTGIFDRFVRGPAAPRGEGCGLGLAIVRRVAEIHGGRVTLDSAPGKGSTFRLVIPAAGPEETVEASSGDEASPAAQESI